METVSVYTDGSCSYKDKTGGWAFLAMFENRFIEHCGFVDRTTTNRMELSGIMQALERINIGPQPMRIFSDSEYSLNAITLWTPEWLANDWHTREGEPVKNADLLLKIHNLLSAHRLVRGVAFSWVKGHNKNPYNEKADYLAGKARRQKTRFYSKEGVAGSEEIRLIGPTEAHVLTVCKISRIVLDATPDKAKKHIGKFSYNLYPSNPSWRRLVSPFLTSPRPLLKVKLAVPTTQTRISPRGKSS